MIACAWSLLAAAIVATIPIAMPCLTKVQSCWIAAQTTTGALAARGDPNPTLQREQETALGGWSPGGSDVPRGP